MPVDGKESSATKRKKADWNAWRKADNLPANKSSMMLRLTSQMFRQHSDIFLQQAAVLERMSSNPSDPESWKVDEPSPESLQDRAHQENAISLSIKSYESMTQVQKRVDYMERLMLRNGVGKNEIVKTRKRQSTAEQKIGYSTRPFDLPFKLFTKEHSRRLSINMDQPGDSAVIAKKIEKLWKGMNPNERLRYKKMADIAADTNAKRQRTGDEKRASIKKLDQDGESNYLTTIEGTSKNLEVESGSDGEKLLFQSQHKDSGDGKELVSKQNKCTQNVVQRKDSTNNTEKDLSSSESSSDSDSDSSSSGDDDSSTSGTHLSSSRY